MSEIDRAKRAAVAYMRLNYPDRKWFIVGGVLRDTDLGVAFKDVDIFVSGFHTDPDPGPLVDDGDRNAYLMRAYREVFHGIELNIIFMRTQWTLQRIAERCDFGICQIGWCPETNKTYRSEAYLHDINDRTLTNTRATTPERLERMEQKFPTFVYRNPRNLPNSTGAWQYVSGSVVKLEA